MKKFGTVIVAIALAAIAVGFYVLNIITMGGHL